jgi:hypothetical protein
MFKWFSIWRTSNYCTNINFIFKFVVFTIYFVVYIFFVAVVVVVVVAIDVLNKSFDLFFLL